MEKVATKGDALGTYFVNLPLRLVNRDTRYVGYLTQNNLAPEIGLDALSLQYESTWHKQLAAELHQNGLSCSVHLPFMDLQPGSLDNLVLEATRTRLRQALDVAALYEPTHMIGHAHFTPVYEDFFAQWLHRSVVSWTQTLDLWPDHPPLFLENTCEKDPGLLTDLLFELRAHDVGFCLDVGHWHCFGGGVRRADLCHWLQAMNGFLRHVHLHDNEGDSDAHLGVGEGQIPWEELFSGLEYLELTPGVTLEPHCIEDLEISQRFMRKNPSWFSRLGVTVPISGITGVEN